MRAPLVAAEPAFTAEGTPWSAIYEDQYHSAQGGIAQAWHVFIAGNELPARWHGRNNSAFVILETGFGLGLSFLATWQAWIEAGRPCPLHFISVEKHPFRREDLVKLLAPHSAIADLAAQLLAQWPPLTPDFHRLHFEGNAVTLTVIFDDAESALRSLVAKVDAVYLDGFSPARNPELWSPALLAQVSRHCKEGCTLATWTVAGDVRRALEREGWTLERRPGFSFKREMLCGRYSPPQRRNHGQTAASPAPTINDHHAIIVGAGLAGAAVAERLTARGWQIDLFEQHNSPAQGASGNPAGIILPRPAKDDALGSRLSRTSYLYALRRLTSFPNVQWSPCGVFQIARDAAHETLQRATSDALKLPHDYLQFFERTDAEVLIGHPLAHGGWWFPGGGWVSPVSLCAALLKQGGSQLQSHFNTTVNAIKHDGQQWMVFDRNGTKLATAPFIVLANAHAASALLPAPLPLTPVRGQISYLPPQTLTGVRHVLCRNGYLTPPESGIPCVGASFDHDDAELDLRVADHAGNLQRLDELLPGAAHGVDPAKLDGRVGLRTTTVDRLPLAGALPDTQTQLTDRPLDPALARLPRLPNAFGLLGLGARGMVWAPLAAELIACQMHGDPLPIERELVDAIDPGRFHLRALRRGFCYHIARNL